MLKLQYITILIILSSAYSLTQTNIPFIRYNIKVELDVNKKTLEGAEIIYWHNSTRDYVSELRLNLFHNGYRNSNSSYAREGKQEIKKWESGYTDINFIKVVDNYNSIVKTNFIQPDDNNLADETVLQIVLDKPVRPDESIKINIGFVTKLPAAGIGRSGYAHGKNFFLVSEWYPKLGVYEEGIGWNCHQFHYWSNFNSNFASYDVGITLPKSYVVGASLIPAATLKNFDDTQTFYFKEDRISDFAWCAFEDAIEFNEEFRTNKLPGVNIKIYLQKENKEKIDRIIYALKNGLKYYGEWIGEFPFKNITLIDLPRSFKDYCSSYPGIFAIRNNLIQLEDDYSLDEKILHSLGHQYFSSSIGVNGVEEPWIDEGIVTYLTGKILQKCYGPDKVVFRVADGLPINGLSIITHRDYPIIAYMGDVLKPYLMALKAGYLENPSADPIFKAGWRYQNFQTYKIGSGYKPALMLETMANYFGSNLVFHSLKTYYTRSKFSRSGTTDWIESVENLLGKKISWFFDQVFYGTEIVDNSVVSIKNNEFKDHKYLIEVVFSRKGAVKIPIDLKIYLENGSEINDTWDCSERWIKKTYISDAPASAAVIDPQNKITLDVNSANNSISLEGNYKPVLKWAAQWLFWMQTLLQTICSIC
jgi:hypothetical protein